MGEGSMGSGEGRNGSRWFGHSFGILLDLPGLRFLVCDIESQ